MEDGTDSYTQYVGKLPEYNPLVRFYISGGLVRKPYLSRTFKIGDYFKQISGTEMGSEVTSSIEIM